MTAAAKPPLALTLVADPPPTEKRPPDRLEQAIAILERMREELRGCFQEGAGGPVNDPDAIAWIAEHDLLLATLHAARAAVLAARTLTERHATIVDAVIHLPFSTHTLAYRMLMQARELTAKALEVTR